MSVKYTSSGTCHNWPCSNKIWSNHLTRWTKIKPYLFICNSVLCCEICQDTLQKGSWWCAADATPWQLQLWCGLRSVVRAGWSRVISMLMWKHSIHYRKRRIQKICSKNDSTQKLRVFFFHFLYNCTWLSTCFTCRFIYMFCNLESKKTYMYRSSDPSQYLGFWLSWFKVPRVSRIFSHLIKTYLWHNKHEHKIITHGNLMVYVCPEI